jgi:hypothetical protein
MPSVKNVIPVVLLTLALLAPAGAVSPTELGAFLAGRALPPESVLAPLQQSDEYREHARLYAAQWFRYDERYFAPMRAWSGSELVVRTGASRQVTYLFGGPDLISALALFPEAGSYVLGGLEPVGKLMNPLELSPEQLHASLAALRKSTEVIMSFNHFITKDMKTDLQSSAFPGVFPVMLVFLSFTDTRITSAERLSLLPDGSLVHGQDAGGQEALRIVFQPSPFVPAAEVIYVQADLSDRALRKNPALLEWLGRRGPATGYLKAASYLPHSGNFSRVRDFLLANCTAIVQDDSGIPLAAYRAAGWRVICFGTYTAPLEIFAKNEQPALREIYASGAAFPLPFGFGYRWQRGESTLLLALPPHRPPRALPVINPAASGPLAPYAPGQNSDRGIPHPRSFLRSPDG